MNNIDLYKDLKEIKENIRTINPEITDELLDLLYEYVKISYDIENQENIISVKDKNGVSWFVDKRSKLYSSIKNS
ncbi:MAG: hypothetical protein IJE43_25810 [Alphaproteobacteria bacterium]|nr:hypothetical protein [Alphaproteobacteria bacterium]MBQ3513235.1 hypothetical protein [Lachnospiraceae bacterium]